VRKVTGDNMKFGLSQNILVVWVNRKMPVWLKMCKKQTSCHMIDNH